MDNDNKSADTKTEKPLANSPEIVISRREKKPLERQTVLLIGVVSLLALLTLILIVLFSFGKTNSKTNPAAAKTTPKPVATITPQKTDASVLASAVSAYRANNNGNYPTTLKASSPTSVLVCGGGCNNTNSSTANLKYYKSSDIQLKQYSSNLKITNPSMLYIVIGATCSADAHSLGSPNSSSFAVLYELELNGSLNTECLST